MPIRRTFALRVLMPAVALACVAGSPPALAAADAQARWDAVADCAARPDDRSRHACVDAVLRDAGLLTPEREAQQQRERFGLDERTARPTPSPAAPSAPATASVPASAPADERLEVQVSKVQQTHDRKLVITTGDGAVWRQTTGGEVRPQPRSGDTLAVRKASLGSYICQVGDTLAFRCSRSR